MTAPHREAAAQFRRRRAAAARMAPLEPNGERDPGNGGLPRREHMPRPARPRKPAPHVRAIVYARAGRTAPPPGATLDDLRTAWRIRPELRTRLSRMARAIDQQSKEIY